MEYTAEDSAKLDAYARSLSKEERAALLALIDRQRCLSLKTYVLKAWPVVERATTFIDGWHIDAIVDHLSALYRGDFLNLLITVPPRTAKSLLVGVFFPTWIWTQKPSASFIYASYAQALSTRDAVKSRRLIQSKWYRDRWGDKFKLAFDQNLKQRYDNDKNGYRIATSVSGILTGEGASFLLAVDDAHNIIEGESDLVREGTITWWNESMSSRGNDPKTIRRLVVQQRVHGHDLAAEVMSQGDYVHLNLPMRFEADNRCFVEVTGWRDPRTTEGELLCPARFGEKEVADLERRLGPYAAAAQLQQRPAPRGGGLIQIAWFKRYKLVPRKWTRLVQSWDTANKAKEENAPWVCTTWLECEEDDYLLDVFRERMEYPEGKRKVYEKAEQWNPDVVLVEDKSSGTSLIQDIRANNRARSQATREERATLLPALVVIPIEPDADKTTRMSTESPVIEAGNVWLPEQAEWLGVYEQELRSFPNSQFSDQVDSTSQYLKWRRQRRHKFVADKPIFTSFVRNSHVAAAPLNFGTEDEPKLFDSKRWLYRGWHVGTHKGVHACVWGQVIDRRLYIMGSRQQSGAFGADIGYEHCEVQVQGLGAFLDEMKELHHNLYPRAQWQDVGTKDVYRPPGTIKQEVPWQVFTSNGLSPTQAFSEDAAVLITYLDAWFEAMVQGEAAVQIAPDAAVVIDALSGGYHWKEEKGGKPAETPFISVMWALEAMVSRLPTKPFHQSSRAETLTEPRTSVHDGLFPSSSPRPERWDQY